MAIKLSICIPTYNRAEYLSETLESIVCQLTDEVEIVISDNASVDNTSDIVRRFMKATPNIIYVQQKENLGADRNYMKSIELASGVYCWLFGSDDVMSLGAIQNILSEINGGLDLYLCGFTECTIDMRPLKDHKMTTVSYGSTFDLSLENERKIYFEKALTSSAFFSFLGSIIVKKVKWNQSNGGEEFIGSLWSHVGKVLGIIPFGLKIKFIGSSFLFKRGGNDSFVDKGLVNRYRIAIDGYGDLGATFFGPHSVEAFHMRRVVRNELSLRTLSSAKYKCEVCSDQENLLVLNRIVNKHYADKTLMNFISLLGYRLLTKRIYGAMKFAKKFAGGYA